MASDGNLVIGQDHQFIHRTEWLLSAFRMPPFVIVFAHTTRFSQQREEVGVIVFCNVFALQQNKKHSVIRFEVASDKQSRFIAPTASLRCFRSMAAWSLLIFSARIFERCRTIAQHIQSVWSTWRSVARSRLKTRALGSTAEQITPILRLGKVLILPASVLRT